LIGAFVCGLDAIGRHGKPTIAPKAFVSWSRKFDEQISLLDGLALVTLRDASALITTLPKKESAAPEWQAGTGGSELLVFKLGPAAPKDNSNAQPR
jgi:hypothetical protein